MSIAQSSRKFCERHNYCEEEAGSLLPDLSMVMTTVRKRLAACYLMSLHGDDYCEEHTGSLLPDVSPW
jgi:hypothetical protein